MKNTDILIVGGDGDLALRKLYRAVLPKLNNCMPSNTQFLVWRARQRAECFLAKVKEWLINYSAANLFNEETWLAFSENLTFVQGDSTKSMMILPALKYLFWR